ncbi:MAG: DNA mismatch repair protein MutS [Defluviitaleaceae bacterium]|nr:DNA mismatch repair protein MutS [Defluviitaleaceae bacterium]
MNHFNTLEFDVILGQLSDCAVSSAAKERCKAVIPADNIIEATRLNNQTSEAKKIMEQAGSPPIAVMTELEKIIGLINADAMLIPEQIGNVATFLISCSRMKTYLKKAESTETDISLYGNSMVDLSDLEEEISRCLHNGQVDDRATPKLHDLRRSIERKGEQIKSKIESLLQKNKQYCADGFVTIRNGRYTMPVKKEYKNKIPGILIEVSNTGSTCFIEPSAISKLQDELGTLKIEEDNEIRTILYTLTALISEDLASIKMNMEAMETLDFVFAKAKLSITMKASQIRLTEDREVRLLSARHPLLRSRPENTPAIPLDFALGNNTKGIIITGPNTGGKTVALKTVGLLSLMAQSGLHVPADERSSICIFDSVWCDIGDGQSISQNLSTFSSHMTNIISILEKTTAQSLILFDELGSGTDPAEGMGIATAILEELLTKGCLFTVTTHYPEIKDFAARTQGIINARMAFDKESLMPLYRLEIGEAGESCALHIAERLGMPMHLLERARKITYSGNAAFNITSNDKSSGKESTIIAVTPLDIADEPEKPTDIPKSQRFAIGDSVLVYPQKDIGIVYEQANSKGEVGVQIKGKKSLINHKRLKLKIAASELYPEDYDFSIIFDSVENRKARHLMGRKHVAGNTITKFNRTSQEN